MSRLTTRYEDVESMLFQGFVSTRCSIQGVPIVLKTLTEMEASLVLLQGEDLSTDWRTHTAYYLAYSTLFFNRQLVLPVRDDWLPELADSYLEFSDRVLVTLLRSLRRLNQRSTQALLKVQAYTYGAASRERWLGLNGTPLCDPRVTGIRGSEYLGLNYHQRLWTYLNVHDDINENYMLNYGLAKFQVSPHAPKEIQKMDRRDATRIKDRQSKRDALFHGRKNPLAEGESVRVSAESPQELLEQMERTMRGEKDFHDLVIEEHSKRVRMRYLEREAERSRMARQGRERALRLRELEGSQKEVTGLSREEVEHIVHKNRDEDARARENPLWADPSVRAEQERNLIRWGFVQNEDIPEDRRDWYDDMGYRVKRSTSDLTENPLMREYYQKETPERDPD